MRQILISPSMLACDFAHLEEELDKCARGGADMIHLDVMDGHFVPNLTFGAPLISNLRPYSSLPFDVHLMITDPLRYAEDFAKAGADLIVFHVESDSDPDATITRILSLGCKAGIALRPGTAAESVFPYLDRLSMLLVMTVEPGFGGQAFMQDMMPKLRLLRNHCDQKGLDINIQVDGGITPETIRTASQNGANVFVAGSAVFQSDNPRDAIRTLKNNAAQAV